MISKLVSRIKKTIRSIKKPKPKSKYYRVWKVQIENLLRMKIENGNSNDLNGSVGYLQCRGIVANNWSHMSVDERHLAKREFKRIKKRLVREQQEFAAGDELYNLMGIK